MMPGKGYAPWGQARLRISGGDPEKCLNRMLRAGVDFRQIRHIDQVSVECTIPLRALSTAQAAARKHLCQLRVLERRSPVSGLKAMGLRLLYPLLLLGIAGLLYAMQNRILFYTVTGHDTVPDHVILEAMEAHGAGFFTDGKRLDQNRLKNQMLSDLPSLSFFSVNQEGSSATVLVREREAQPVILQEAAPADLIASRDAVITAVQTEAGNAVVKKGDTVRQGDLLISGILSLERVTLLTRARGEIYGRTWHPVRAILPPKTQEKRLTGRQTRLWSLRLGKKTINFYKTSGILYDSYDTIISTSELTLPGGYGFPAALICRTLREYTLTETETEALEAEALLTEQTLRQLSLDMRAGTVLHRRFRIQQASGAWVLRGTAECQEEIGRAAELQ